MLLGHRHTSCGPAGSAFSLGCLPSKGLGAPAAVGKPWRGAGRLDTIPTSTFVVAGDPLHVGGKSDLPSNEVREHPDLGAHKGRRMRL